MKKNKITRSMCVFIAATMLPLEAIVSLAAETAHTAVFGKSDEDVVQTTKNADIESVFSNSLDLICESKSDTTVTLSWNNMFSDGNGTYDIYLDSVLVQGDLTETTYTLTDLEAANMYDISVKAVNQNGEVTETSDDISVITDLVITKDTALWEETTVGNLYINGGTLNLNEQTLHVNGDVILSDGTFMINGGTVDIGGDLRIQRRVIDSSGNTSYYSSYGCLNMTNENDYVMVGGNFITNSYCSHSGYLTNGTLEVKGDFTQISGNDSNFNASGNHKTILSGDKFQTVAGNSTNLHFATLELQNFSEEGVHFNQAISADSFIQNGCNVSFENSGVLGWKLEADEEFNGDLNLIGDTLDLNGHKLTVNGDLTQSGGEVKINGGELVVTGDYKIQTVGNEASPGKLNMTNKADKVTVAGSFATRSTVDHSNLLTAGTMTIGGDLYQYDNSIYNFKTSGTHKIVLNGTEKQTVSLDSRDNEKRARFNILEITNTSEEGVIFATDVRVQTKLYDTESIVVGSAHIYLSGEGELADNSWSYDLNINQNKTLNSDWVIGGSLYVRNYTFNLNGHKLEVDNDVAVGYYGTMYINNGQLYVGRDLRVQNSRIQNDGTIGYDDYSCGYLKMTNVDDFVKVGRNFVTAAYYSHSGYLTNGILEVKGNFTQISRNENNFYATGDHKVVLSGEEKQTISFASPNARFANLEITNTSDDGVYVSSYFNADKVTDENNKLEFADGRKTGWVLEKDEVVESFDLIYGTLDLNGHKLTVNGDLTQSGGEVKINGGELVVTGDYKIQTVGNEASPGKLNMTNKADKVTVAGSFATRSTVDHSNLLTAGTMTIGGDLYQYDNSIYNFKTSGTHKIVLNGTEKQTVSLDSRDNEKRARFNILEITNTSEEGVIFATDVWVQTKLYDTESIVVGSAHIYLSGEGELADNSWSYDLNINQNKTLNSDWVIGGSLYVRNYTFNLNGHKLEVDNDVAVGYYGTMYINNGQLYVGRDLRVQNSRIQNDGTIDYDDYSCGYLKMTNEDDFVKVGRNFVTAAYYSHSGYLTNGILEVKGNFTQISRNENNFYATGDHKVVLSGEEKQTISFASPNARFANLEITNTSDDGVYVSSYFNADKVTDENNKLEFADGRKTGWVLEKDEVVESFDLIYGTLDLNGHKLTVNGDLTQSGGEVKINGGELVVTGDYKIQTVGNEASPGKLNMTNKADKVTVAGSFATRSTVDHSNLLTAGTMTIGGDLYQYDNSIYNFKTSGTHKIVLNGTEKQTVSLDSRDNEKRARFNILEITNTSEEGVIFATDVWVQTKLYDTESIVVGSAHIYLSGEGELADNSWSYDLNINQNKTLNSDWVIGGSLYVRDYTFNLNGHKLEVDNDVAVGYYGTMYINNGQLYAGRDLRVQNSRIQNDGTIGYDDYSCGYLKMTNEDDFVKVGRNFVTAAYYSHSGYLTNGILEVKGNFTQISRNENNFYATGDHKVVLSGEEKQTISFASPNARFANLEITNTSDDGVYVSSYFNADKVTDENNKLEFADGRKTGWVLEKDEVVESFDLIYGTFDLNGHKLTVNGDLTQSGGEVKINGGELVVTGDYKIQTVGNEASPGKLNMTNKADKVTVAGSFATRSTVDHSNLLTAGTMTIGGDLYQYDNSIYNFKTSGTHKIVLNGTEKQTVSLDSRDNEKRARFNILEITNTSEEGVIFATDVWVQTKLYDTESIVVGSAHIYLSGEGELADNSWSYDLNINQNKTLNSDWVIGGSLYVRDYTFNLNGHKLEVDNDVAVGYYGTMYINNGQLYVGRDLRVQNSRIQNDGTIGYDDYSCGYLKMTNVDDFVKVGRNFVTAAYYSHSGYLTNGILEVKGNFTQISRNENNFYATGDHKVVLSGTKQQKINFSSANSKFNVLEINKPMDTGYVFNRTPVWNELVETAMDTQAPSAPKNLKSDLQTVTSISLKWSESMDNNAVTGYDVYRNGVRVGSTNKIEFIDDRLKSNTSYTYYVIAYDAMHNESDWSNIIEVKTLPDENAHTQPTGLKVKSQTLSSVVLNWTASTDNSKVEGYDVYRNDILIGTVNGTSFTDNSISSGLYVYYVKAFDDTDNYSEASEKLTVDTEPPTTPVLEIESSTNTQAVISWNCTDNVGVSKYEIFRNDQKIATVTKNTYTDKSLSYDENYEYYVIAYDKSNNASEKSSTVTVYTGEDTEAPTVTAIYPNANTFAQSIPLTIYAKDNASVTSIAIEVSTDGEVWETVDTVSANGSASTYVKYDLDISEYADGSLYVRAKASDAKGNESDSSQSPVIEYTVDNTAPSKLKNVKTAVVNGQLEIQWGEPTDKDVNYFRVYKSYSDDETFTLLKDKLEALNYFDTDIELAEMYDYYVTAVDYAGNESEKSEIVSGGVSDDTFKPQILSVVPKNGTKICNGRTMSISCKDNFRLGSILVEFAPQGTELWETMYTQNLSQNAEIVKFDLDMNNMADGMYDVRVQATDKSGNKSSYYTCAYDYKSCSIVAPKLFATERGWQIKLNWSSTTDSSLLGYNLYKRSSDNSSFVLVGSTILNEYTDNNVKAGQTYFYYVEAIDSYNNIVASEKVMAVPTDEDTVKPVADAGIDLYGLVGMSIQFDGSKSSDNHYIASYEWDFGDGSKASSAKANHIYSDPGTYTASLTVKDSAGNASNSKISVTVHDEDTYGYAEVQLVDSSRNTSVANAMVYAELPDGDILVNTNSNGVATVYAPFGTYKMSFYKDGYLPVSADITIEKGGSRTTVYIENGELVTGKIEVKRLDLQEIENLGIDTSAPENQYVYNYNVNVKTDDPQNPKKFQITVNGDGELINTDSWFEFNGVKFGILDMNTDHIQYVGVIPSTVPGEPPSVVLLDVSTTFTWLKEFFNVSLTVQNNASHEFYIGNANAKITLPEGMSLAKTNTDNSASRSMGTIYGGETSTVSWIVRGDTAGTYDIFADFSGILAPFNEPVTTKFKTDKPIKVYGGDALKLVIEQEYYDDTYNCWQVDFKLTNVSDITIYNPSVNYSGYSEFLNVNDMTVVYPNGIIDIIPWENGNVDKKNIQRFLPALLKDGESETISLKPGESIVGHYSASKKTLSSNFDD